MIENIYFFMVGGKLLLTDPLLTGALRPFQFETCGLSRNPSPVAFTKKVVYNINKFFDNSLPPDFGSLNMSLPLLMV